MLRDSGRTISEKHFFASCSCRRSRRSSSDQSFLRPSRGSVNGKFSWSWSRTICSIEAAESEWVSTHDPIEFQRLILKCLKPLLTSFHWMPTCGRWVSFLIRWLFDCFTWAFALLVATDFFGGICLASIAVIWSIARERAYHCIARRTREAINTNGSDAC